MVVNRDKSDQWNAENVLYPGNTPFFSTKMGVLFEGDCCQLLGSVRGEVVDTVFADPPFNLGKKYGGKVDDRRPDDHYVMWCKRWIDECIRVLKPGGAFFIYNIPKWNIVLGEYLMERGLTFQNWIALSLTSRPPMPGRLYPSHYSLLYYTKGKPKTFRRIRTPIKVCRHCGGDIKDYGGYRDTMHPDGVNLRDVWDDIPPVRHAKFKSKKRKANQLSTKLVRRAIELTTKKGEVVLDPFGGAGTTFDVCEAIGRHWIGIELQYCDVIVERLTTPVVNHHAFDDFVETEHDGESPKSKRTKPWKGQAGWDLGKKSDTLAQQNLPLES